MDLKEQRYVVTLADTGNLTKAANKLGISQPALSLYIKNLERQFGELLFSRENRRITPTYLGEIYIAKAREILGIGKEFQEELGHIKNGSKGKVSFGIPYWQSANVLPKVLPIFKSEFPDIEVVVKEVEDEHDLLSLLDERRIDLGIVERPVAGYSQTMITEEKLFALVSSKNDLAKTEAGVELDSFKSAILVHESEHETSHLTSYLKNNLKSTAGIIMPLKSQDAILSLVRRDYGLAIMPESALDDLDMKSITALPVKELGPVKTLSALTRKDDELSPYAQCFLAILENKVSIDL